MTGTYIWLDQDKSGDLYITVKLDPEDKEAAEMLQKDFLRGKRKQIEIREVQHESD